jgi:casein kinase II subunit beta
VKETDLIMLEQDAVEEEDEEEEDEEEEEAPNVQMQHQGKRQHATGADVRSLRPPTPIHSLSPSARTSPTSTAPPQTPRDISIADSVSVGPLRSYCSTGKVRVIKQWTRDSDAAWATAKV